MVLGMSAGRYGLKKLARKHFGSNKFDPTKFRGLRDGNFLVIAQHQLKMFY